MMLELTISVLVNEEFKTMHQCHGQKTCSVMCTAFIPRKRLATFRGLFLLLLNSIVLDADGFLYACVTFVPNILMLF